MSPQDVGYLSLADFMRQRIAEKQAQEQEQTAQNDFVDVAQGAFAGGVAGMLETGDVIRRGVEGALGLPERDVLATRLASGLRGVQARNQPAPEDAGTFWGEGVPSAVGSAASFMLPLGAAGAALKLGRAGAAAASGIAGFAQMAGPAYYEAKARGRSDLEAWTAFVGQGAVGSTEAAGALVPGAARLGAWLAGANRVTGGSFARAVGTAMLREGAQETGQGTLEVLFNKYAMAYPEAQRSLVDILKDKAVQEGAPGALLGALFGAVEFAAYGGAQEGAGSTQAEDGSQVEPGAQTQPQPAVASESLTPDARSALARFQEDAQAPDAELVEPSEGYAPAVEFARRRGHSVQVVRTTAQQEGYFEPDTGTIFVREGLAPQAAMDVVRGHEMAHALKNRDAATWSELRDEIAASDAEGLSAFETIAAERYAAATGRELSADLQQEEGVSYWTQNVLSPWLRQLEGNPARLAKLAVDNRTFFQKIVEAGLDLLNSFGAKFQTRRAELAALRSELGKFGTRLTVEQGRSLADRYVRAMNGLEAEFAERQAVEADQAATAEAAGAFQQAAVEQPATRQEPQLTPAQRRRAQKKARKAAQREAAQQTVTALSVPKFVGDLVQLPDGRVGRVVETTGPTGRVRMRVRVDRQTLRREASNPDVDLVADESLEVLEQGGEVVVNEVDAELVERQEPTGELARQRFERGQAERVGSADPRFAFAIGEALADSPLVADINKQAQAYRAFAATLHRQFVDALDPVRAALPQEYESETLRRSATGEKIAQEVEPRRKKFVETMRKHGITLDEIGDFVQARGAALRNYYMGLINQQKTEAGELESVEALSGMSNERAAEILAAARAAPNYDGFVELARQYDAMNKRVRETWRNSGDKSAKEIEALEKAYSHETAKELGLADPNVEWDSYYTAYRTAFDEESLEGIGLGKRAEGGGQGVGISGSPTRTPLGRRSEASNPIPFAFVDLQSAIIRAGKLEVQREVAARVEQRNDPQFARVVTIPTKRMLNTATGLVEDMPDPTWRSRPEVLPFKTKEGKLRAIVFSRRYAHLAPILKGETLSRPIRLLGIDKATRTMGALLTRLNPAFFAANYWRDLAQVTLAAYSKQGIGFARDVLAKQRRSISANYRAEFGGEMDAMMREYRESGARIGSYGFQDYAESAALIERNLRGGRVREATQAMARLIGGFNDIAENATRYAVYQTARERGMSIKDAAFLAKQEIGVNFERRGEYGPVLSSLYAFANAGIQGNANALSAFGTRRGAAAVASIAALGVLIDQMNRAISGEDDDGEPIYDNRPEWQKNANLLIETGGRTVVQIPMPHAWRWFFNIGRRINASVQAGQYSVGEFIDVSALEIFDTLTPLGAGPPEQAASPTVLDPVVQLSTNRAWTGKRIAPENLPFGPQKPASQLYWRDTPELAVDMARVISEMTQTDDSGKGAVEISPNHIEHFFRVALGGLGSTVVTAGENVADAVTGTMPKGAQTVLLNRFMGEASPWAIDTRFSNARKEAQEAKARYDELRKAGEGARALEWRRVNLPLFESLGALRMAEKQLERLPNTPENEERRRAIKARFNARLREARKDTDS